MRDPDDNAQVQPPNALRSFLQILQVAEDGRLLKDLTEAVQKIGEQLRFVELNGGKPSAKLKVEFEIKLDRGLVDIVSSYDVKTPKPRRARTVLHLAPDGTFYSSDFHQPNLPFRDANVTAGQVRTVIG